MFNIWRTQLRFVFIWGFNWELGDTRGLDFSFPFFVVYFSEIGNDSKHVDPLKDASRRLNLFAKFIKNIYDYMHSIFQ